MQKVEIELIRKEGAVKKHYIDKWLVAAFFLLIVLGIIMVYSSSAFYARQYWGDHLFFLKRHLKFLIVGFEGYSSKLPRISALLRRAIVTSQYKGSSKYVE